jgi:hypothetical protein
MRATMTEPLSDRRELEIDGLRIAYEQAGEGSLLRACLRED